MVFKRGVRETFSHRPVETGYIPPLSAPLADTPNKAEVSVAPSASFLFETFVLRRCSNLEG